MGRSSRSARLVKNADDYKLDGLKLSDGTDADDRLKDFVRAQATDLALSPAAATKFAEATLKHLESGTAAKTADETAAATKALEQLRQSWGPNYEANKVIADNAYAAMMKAAGFDQPTMTAAIQKLGAVGQAPRRCRCSLLLARRLARTSSSAAAGRAKILDRAMPNKRSRIAELKGDTTWVSRYLAGGTAENKEMNDLHTLAYGA
jgi:hypothetical protein